MAANMQHMAGAGQMMPQQVRRPNNPQLQHVVYENLVSNPPPVNPVSWQSGIPINERLSKTMTLITNITLAVPSAEQARALEFACAYERDAFIKLTSREAYDQAMAAKTMDFFKKRQANEPNIQNALNTNIQQIQAQQNMMNMQAQMGRGMGPQQGFQHLQHPMQASQIPQQQQLPQQPQLQQAQQQQLSQQQQMMGMGLGMPNQAGRGMAPNQQQQQPMMGMLGAQNRPPQAMPTEFSRLANSDKAKVAELAMKMMNQATEQQKAAARHQIQTRIPPQQLAELQAQGRDPVVMYYQRQAFNVLTNNMNRLQQNQSQNGQQNQNTQNSMQAAMMQAQQSQQSMQQRSNMMNAAPQNTQQNAFGADGSQFAPNMDSIKDQQMNGFMAQQAGQMVVPASQGGPRTSTPMNQNMANQQGQNQAQRPKPQQTPQQMPQQHQNLNAQQLNMNQTAQQTQAQLQAQMRQMQGQQQGMAGGMAGSMVGGMAGGMNGAMPNGLTGGMAGTQQSPGMNTLNTPVSRPPNNMNGIGPQGMGPGAMAFGDQRFNQGIQRPNNQAFNSMLANMSQEQRQAISAMPPEKLNEVLRKWQTSRQAQMGMDAAGQMNPNHIQNRPQSQLAQMPGNVVGPAQHGLPLPGPPGTGIQQMATPRPGGPNAQTQAMMDSMDLPPQVVNQIGSLPPEIRKWRDLKSWATANNLSHSIQNQLRIVQQKQFAILMTKRGQQQQQQQQQQQGGQNPNMNDGMQVPNAAMPQQQVGMQRPMGNIPPQIFQVTPQEIMHLRTQRPQFASMSDEQIRQTILQIKRTNWQQQQMRLQQGMQQQAGAQNPMQPAGGPMAMGQPPMQVTQVRPPSPAANQTPRAQPGGTNVMSQTASMQRQPSGKKQQTQAPEQPRNKRQKSTGTAAQPTPSPAQGNKSLKRSSPDITVDARPSTEAAAPPAQPQLPQGLKLATPQQLANMPPERRTQYENFMKMQMAKNQQNGNQTPQSNENLARLKEIAAQEQKQLVKEVMPDLPMGPEELAETLQKLQRIVIDMNKIVRGLNKWYAITRDDARAKAFFRTRLRIMRQFADGEPMSKPKNIFSIRCEEIDAARKMFESMAKDLAASVYGRSMKKPVTQAAPQQGASQDQAAQQQQQQQQQAVSQAAPMAGMQSQPTPPAPLNAANLEKNAQALNKMNQQKATNKGAQATGGSASSGAQQSFQLSGASPHGAPSYIGKPKDMNLQLPPARNKRQKVTHAPGSQAPQGSATSPQGKKPASPELQRVVEQQAPAKPFLHCKEPDCAMSTVGYQNEQALQQHVEEEHVKPREDPTNFVQESLAMALGLEPDGTAKKESKPQFEAAQPMSATTSKQGFTPGNLAATPKGQEAAMKRSGSAMSKQHDKMAGKANDAAKADAKPEAKEALVTADPWANATIDPTALLSNLGYEPGIPGIISDIHLFRNISPQEDTPESAKDSGTSEPNSDVSEGANLDIDIDWQLLEPGLLLDLGSTSLAGDLGPLHNDDNTLNPSLLMSNSVQAPVDWDDIETDFSKPFQLDTSFYELQT